MAPLLPSESAAYTLTLPTETDDDRLNLKLRTGAALVYTRSSVVVYGGLIVGLGLDNITIPNIQEQLNQLKERDQLINLVSNEIFYLNIINRQWSRLELDHNQLKPKPRFYHSLAFRANSIYLFGGLVVDEETNEITASNDLWEYSIDSKEWICIDDGTSSGTVARYDHSTHIVDYISPADNKAHRALAITGGRGELNQELTHIAFFDLETRKYVNTSEMNLNLHELSVERNPSASSGVDPKALTQSEPSRLKVASESSFVISASSSDSAEAGDDTFYCLSSPETATNDVVQNPLVSLPIVPHASGLRLPISATVQRNTSVVPNDLKYPSGGIFGSNIIVSGFNTTLKEYQVYLFNKPSQKWTRLNIDTKKKASELYLWKSFSWPSHHKVLVLGSAVPPPNASYSNVQTFDLVILVGLPITNIFHTFSLPESTDNKSVVPRFSSLKENTSFEAYSKYVAPKSQISSIRSVFPNYAVTLGKNAFEKYGASLSDFEFISADGDKVNAPLMLLRKRWGRCFDMLLSKAYARAVYKLESEKEEEDNSGPPTTSTDSNENVSTAGSAKRSFLVFNKAANASDRDVPEFRLPFQDKLAPTVSVSSSLAPTGSGGPTSRKTSVVSNGNASLVSDSTNDGGAEELDFDKLPPQLPIPNEPLPTLEKLAPLKAVHSRDYLRDSPRGSVSGASIAASTGSNPYGQSSIKLQDLRSSAGNARRKQTSRQASLQTTNTDDTSVSDIKSNLESIVSEFEDDTTLLLEPLLIPRSLYLPFNTNTVTALSEFLFTGQLGDKWLLAPVTTDNFLIAKFYEIPLLYDLISEVLYAIIGKKEDSLIKDYGKLLADYQTKVEKIFKGNEVKIEAFFLEHPHVKESFNEIETYLNTVDDGFLNLALLRKASKVSTFSSAPSTKGSFDYSERPSSVKSGGRFGKSSLSKEVGAEQEENEEILDDLENEKEDEVLQQARTEPVKFKTETMSLKSPRKPPNQSDVDDDLDPLTKGATSNGSGKEDSETKSIHTRRSNLEDLDEEDPLSGSGPSVKVSEPTEPLEKTKSKSKSESDSSETAFQVPEGRFTLAKDQLKKVHSEDSSEIKDSTSDSDDMAVGLGLVNNLKLKEKKKKTDPDYNENEDDEEEDDELNPDANLPTLGNLASPNSPPPGNHLLQIIFETAALACDMKLLLRSVNVLEMSRFFGNRRTELLKELDEYGLRVEEERVREDLILKEKEKLLRQKEKQDAQLKERKEARRHRELREDSASSTEHFITVPVIEVERDPTGRASTSNDQIDVHTIDVLSKSPRVTDVSRSPFATPGPSDTNHERISVDSGRRDSNNDNSDAASRISSFRSRFSSFRSVTSLTNFGPRSSAGEFTTREEQLRNKTSRNPFSALKKNSESGKSGFFSFRRKKSKTPKQTDDGTS